jgi:hypothetical protein
VRIGPRSINSFGPRPLDDHVLVVPPGGRDDAVTDGFDRAALDGDRECQRAPWPRVEAERYVLPAVAGFVQLGQPEHRGELGLAVEPDRAGLRQRAPIRPDVSAQPRQRSDER